MSEVEVVMGHRVTDAPLPPVGPDAVHSVAPRSLDAFLRRHAGHRKGSVRELLEVGSAPAPGLLVTFDDGFRDVLLHALPVLEANGTPCVVFVTPGFVDGAAAPCELGLARLVAERDALRLPGAGWRAARTRAEKERSYRELRALLQGRLPEAQRAALLELARANDWTPPVFREFLDWDEIRELDRHPLVTIGAHGLTHASLPQSGARRARREIAGSKARLQAVLGHEVECFAYPYGEHTRVIRALVRCAGFRYAFTTHPERARCGPGLRRTAIPRFDLAEVAPAGAGLAP